jgi:mRNA interferase MazF
MEKFAIGSVVLVAFPFPNLKGKKIRPALSLAHVEFNNLILCQITSKPYSSKSAIKIKNTDFEKGSLPLISHVRPDKLLTTDNSIIERIAGKLTTNAKKNILQKVQALFL